MFAILLRVMLQLHTYLADDRMADRALDSASNVRDLLRGDSVVSTTIAIKLGGDLLEEARVHLSSHSMQYEMIAKNAFSAQITAQIKLPRKTIGKSNAAVIALKYQGHFGIFMLLFLFWFLRAGRSF